MNKFERYSVPLRELYDGNSQNIRVFQITGENPGPHAYIQAGIHGAELQGNLVIQEILGYLRDHPLRGVVTLVPFCNPQALAVKMGHYSYGRFNPITGENWNRSYRKLNLDYDAFAKDYLTAPLEDVKRNFKKEILLSLENFYKKSKDYYFWPNENEGLCLTLQKLAAPADIVLDLHTGPKSTRYLYASEKRREESRHLNFPHIVLIPPIFAGAIDEATFVPWHTLEEAFEKLGEKRNFIFSSYTLELGSEERVNESEAKVDAQRILHYLAFRGMLQEDRHLNQETHYKLCHLKNLKSYHCPASGAVEYLKSPGESFVKGETLAKIYRPGIIENFDSIDKSIFSLIAREDGIVISHFASANVREGVELFCVMIPEE